jgi:hypothetical protein
MYTLKQSSTEQPLVFLMVESADHITPLTGASPTVTISKNGGSFGSPSGSVSEIANGWYQVAGNSTDTGTLGPLILHATATSGDPTDVVYDVVKYDMQDGVRLGLTAVPSAAVGSGANSFNFDASGNIKNDTQSINGIAASSVTTVNAYIGTTVNPLFDANSGIKADVIDWLGTAVTAATGGIPDVNAKNINNVSTGSVTTVNANVGTTSAITFDGNGYTKVDLVDVAGSALSTSSAQIGVNVVNIGGSASQGAAGYVGIDWSKIDNPTATVGLSGTTVGTTTAVTDQVTANVTDWASQSVSVDANNSPNVSAKYWAGTAITATSIPVATAAGASGGLLIAGSNAATTFATLTSTGAFTINGTSDVAQTGDSYARIGSNGAGLTSLAPAATALSTANWTNTRAGYLDNLSGGAVALESEAVLIYNRIGAPAGASVSADIAALTSDVLAIPTNPYTGTPPTANQNADAFLGRNIAGGSSSGRTVSECFYAIRNKNVINESTFVQTIYATDDATISWQTQLTSAAGATPVSGSAPTS